MKTLFHMIVFKTYHAQRNTIRLHMSDYGLSPGQPKVLRYVAEHEDCKLKDIALACDVEPATVSKLLNALEDTGMLTRVVDKGNKRALQLRITDKGSTALSFWNTHCQEVEEQSLAGFDDVERQQFESYLCRMYQNLTNRTIE